LSSGGVVILRAIRHGAWFLHSWADRSSHRATSLDECAGGVTVRTRRVLFVVGLVLTLALAVNGLLGGASQLSASHTPGERLQTDTQFAFGILALLLPLAMLTRRFMRVTVVCWTIALTAAGAIAPVVWAGSSAAIGVLAGVASAAIALALAWLMWVGAARGADAIDSTT
jgi:hypothetical protein